jgi:outer membrane protein OmpA-like peptidoglycan-associated protein
MRQPAIATGGRGLLLLALVGALVVVGPAWAQDAATIAQAQDALEAARSTRAVRALAAPELDAAEQALERALAARDAGRSRSEVEHLAYLAERRAAIARMHAEGRQIARTLQSLSATHAQISEARALEAAVAEQHARALAQRLARFDVHADRQGLLLTPREPWFEADLAPAPRALRAIAEAARLLAELPEREVVVLGYATRRAPPQGAAQGTRAAGWLPAGHPTEGVMPQLAADRDNLGCARADIVRALLISHGVDPRRIDATCVAPEGPLEALPAGVAGPPAGEAVIAISTKDGPPWAPTIGQALDPGSATP